MATKQKVLYMVNKRGRYAYIDLYSAHKLDVAAGFEDPVAFKELIRVVI